MKTLWDVDYLVGQKKPFKDVTLGSDTLSHSFDIS